MRISWLLVATCLLSSCGPREAPFIDAARVADLDAVLRGAVDSGDIPGVVAVITTRDSVIYRRAFGVMDDTGKRPVRVDGIFQIFSMTKPITSVGVMQLVEEGLIQLDAPAGDYLPELRGREVLVSIDTATSTFTTRPPARDMTVRDLLRHTSGFGYAFSSPELAELDRVVGLPDRKIPLLHDPGERWTYGMGPAFLGWIIEAVSGESLSAYLNDRILSPLGMGDTSFDLAPQDKARLVALFRRVGDTLEGQRLTVPYLPFVRGDGGLLSTADDYARFLQMILGRGEWRGKRLLKEESVAEMTRNQLGSLVVEEQPGALPAWSNAFPLGAGRDGFGLGFQVRMGDEPGTRPSGSLSWAGLENTHFWVDMKNGIGVVLLMQVLPFYDEKVIGLLTDFEHALYVQPDA